ncbi:anti-sigma factor [Flavitalea flava]
MTTGHLSEMELQQYALDEPACTKETREHIEACTNCQAEVMTYRLLFAGIKQQPKPEFAFDLSGLVLSQLTVGLKSELPGARARVRSFSFSAWLLVLFTTCTVGIPIYLFRKNIWNMFSEISGFFLYIILVAAAIAVISRMVGMYRKFRRQIQTLNYY